MRKTGVFFFFFFQAEDGIRDYKVTGVQTCALPISSSVRPTVLDVGSVVGRTDDAPQHARDAGGEGLGPFPLPSSPFPFSPLWHIRSRHTAPHARPAACAGTARATTPTQTSPRARRPPP